MIPSISAAGAAITVIQMMLPRTPLTFAFGMIEQNGIQAAAFTASNVMILRSNGTNNPLAATQYAVLNAAVGLPLTYMQAIDGQAYGFGGLNASYTADAAISFAACVVLGVLLRRRTLAPAPEAVLQAEGAASG